MLRFLSLVATAGATAVAPVMNAGGVPYVISNAKPQPGGAKRQDPATWAAGEYSTNFQSNVLSAANPKVEFFDVYGEVQTKYSQVYWTRNTAVPLPDDLVKRFAGKLMAITGYEVDQVTHDPNDPRSKNTTTKGSVLGGFACGGVQGHCSDSDKSVPIYNAYNHHYFGWLAGADSEMVELDKAINWPNPTKTAFRTKEGTPHTWPTNLVFKENPGGEYRKSYHGYPAGYAQLLHSPRSWSVEPMQIDTHNRKYGINEAPGFHRDDPNGFLPKRDTNDTTDGKLVTENDNDLSPLIECPCSDRITRSIVKTESILLSGTCKVGITTAAACTAAIGGFAAVSASRTVSNALMAAGCILQPNKGASTVQAIFNTAKSAAACSPAGAGKFTWSAPQQDTLMNCATAGGCLKASPTFGCTGEMKGQCTWDSSAQAQVGCGKDVLCTGFFCGTKVIVGQKKLLCFGRSASAVTTKGPSTDTAWKKVFSSHSSLAGAANLGGLVNLTVAHDGTTATITVTGPSAFWYGVGFDATSMKDAPYSIIVDGKGAVTERKLIEHGPGALLPASVKVSSNKVAGGIRTVVLTRPVSGSYKIPTTPGTINVITAIGNTVELAYHKTRTGASITLLPTALNACVCEPVSSAYLTYTSAETGAAETQKYGYNCLDEPRSDMLKRGDGTGRALPNAACQMETYHGGLRCCQHHFFLTDKEQNKLIPNVTDTYFLKWRYYFQEYSPKTATKPASHKHIHHWVFLIDANVNDYEEDNDHYGNVSVGHITAHLTVSTMGLEDVPAKWNTASPVVMTPHMHAPNAIREEFWDADTGEIICNVTALYGNEKWGKTSEIFNEASYIAIPPCIFGSQPGLQTPYKLGASMNITAHKYFNNTFRHLGQMAQWTGLVVYDTDPY